MAAAIGVLERGDDEVLLLVGVDGAAKAARTWIDRPSYATAGRCGLRPAAGGRRHVPAGRAFPKAMENRDKGVIASFCHEVVDEALAEISLRVVDVDEQSRKRRDDAARSRTPRPERIRIGVSHQRHAKEGC